MQRRFGLDCINYLSDAATVAKVGGEATKQPRTVDRADFQRQTLEQMIRDKEQELSRLTESLRHLREGAR